MENSFFGEFLVASGALSQQDLETAILYQKENNKLLGELAVEKSMLSRQQVFDCLYLQRKTRKKFGKIALEKGYLSQDQLSILLARQAENHIFIGEAIVRNGMVSGDKMNGLVNEYKRKVLNHKHELSQRMAGIGDRNQISVCLTCVRDVLFQLGFVSKLSRVDEGLAMDDDAKKNLFSAQQRIEDKETYIGLACNDSMLDMISRVMLNEFEEDNTYRLYEVMNDLITQINTISCEDLTRQGILAKPGLVKNIAPTHAKAWTFTIRTMPYTFHLVYFL